MRRREQENLIGKKFNDWTVLSFVRFTNRNTPIWECECKCGNKTNIASPDLKRGKSKRCVMCSNRLTFLIHGEGSKCKRSKEYTAWLSIKQRCYNKNIRMFHSYGGRGIKVCNRWIDSYQNFLADMDRAPSKTHSIDRINVDGDYEPSNCRWATKQKQSNNRRNSLIFTYKNKNLSLKEWCDEMNLNYVRIYTRVARLNWDFVKAITTP